MLIDKQDLDNIFTSQNDSDKLNQYLQDAKDEKISFASSEVAFIFFIILFTHMNKLLSPTFNSIDFLSADKVNQDTNFYKIYETLFIAETFISQPNEDNLQILQSYIILMYLEIAKYCLYTYRYMEALENVASVLKIEEGNQTALFIKGLCCEALLQFGHNLQQKVIVLLCDIYHSIDYDKVFFDKIIVKSKLSFYKSIDVSEIKEMGLIFDKVTKTKISEISQNFWSEENTFYIVNKLHVNPLCEVEAYFESTNELIIPIDINDEIRVLYNSIINDFKYIRNKMYVYDSSTNKKDQDIIVVFQFLYSIFDKIGYLLYKFFDLNIKEYDVNFSTIFTSKLCNTKINLLEVKNQYLYSMYHISREYSNKNKHYNPMDFLSKGTKEVRNLVTHRSTSLTNGETVYAYTLYLSKVVRRCIIYTNLALHIEEIRKKMGLKHTDLIFYDPFTNDPLDINK